MGEAKRRKLSQIGSGLTDFPHDLSPYIDPDWAKWLFLAAFYDQVAGDHLKAGHILGREEFLGSGAIVMLPVECLAIIAQMGMPFRFVQEHLPSVLDDKRAQRRNGLSGIEIARR